MEVCPKCAAEHGGMDSLKLPPEWLKLCEYHKNQEHSGQING